MSRSIFIGAALIAVASAQCGAPQVDSANCASWLRSGFCSNTFYTPAQKQAYCGNACGLCTAAPATTAAPACVDSSANCATWIPNGFCNNAFYTAAQKQQYCAKSCNLCGGAAVTTTPAVTTTTEPPPQTPCAAAFDATKATTAIIGVSPLTAPYPVGMDFMGGAIARVFVNNGCTLTLNANPMDATGGTVYPGTGTYVAVAAADATAQSAGCTCP